jgi:hypothetical protein
LLQEISKYPTGTTIFCHNPNSIISLIIRLGLNCYWDHSATLVWYDNIPYIVEAKAGELIHKKCFFKWLSHRQNNRFGLSYAKVDIDKIESQFGKAYDYKAVLFYMIIWRLTGKWIGPINEKAKLKWFCFELTAWFRGLAEWWNKTPKDMIN